jgi:hypothetical protein
VAEGFFMVKFKSQTVGFDDFVRYLRIFGLKTHSKHQSSQIAILRLAILAITFRRNIFCLIDSKNLLKH